MGTKKFSGLFFISVETGECISYGQLEDSKWLRQVTIWSDGRICAGYSGHCAIFQPPREVQDIFSEYARRMYSPVFSVVPFLSPPLEYVFDGIKEKSVTFQDALYLILSSNYHHESIDQWAKLAAHGNSMEIPYFGGMTCTEGRLI